MPEIEDEAWEVVFSITTHDEATAEKYRALMEAAQDEVLDQCPCDGTKESVVPCDWIVASGSMRRIVDAREDALHAVGPIAEQVDADRKLYGNGFIVWRADGTMERLDPRNVVIKAEPPKVEWLPGSTA